MKKIVAVFLAIQVSLPVSLFAQQPANAEPARAMIANSLKILVLEGQGAINRIDTRQGTAPVVEVRDENDRPIEGASVVFRLPPTGAGGTFAGEALSKTQRTNSQGQAMAAGFVPNNVAGAFRIHVTASAGNRLGELDIEQSNSSKVFVARPRPTGFKFSKKWKLAAIGAAAGVAIAIVLVTTRGSTAPVNPTVTITPGPVTIGGR